MNKDNGVSRSQPGSEGTKSLPTRKVGDSYFRADVDPYDGTVSVSEYIVSSVKSDVVHLIQKNPYTWVKRSSVSGDYGWAKNIDPVWRYHFRHEAGPAVEWARTKAAAYSKALPDVDAAIKRLTRVRAQLTGQRTKARARNASGGQS